MTKAEELIGSKENDLLADLLEKDPALAIRKTAQGISLLQFAAYCRNSEAVKLLRGYTPSPDVFEAASIGELETVKHCVEQDPALAGFVSPDGFTPLGLAAFFSHPDIVRWLLDRGADPNKASNNPMKVAPLHSACAIAHYDIAEMLIGAGAAVNTRQSGGVAPIHSAAYSGHTRLVKLLVDHGADTDAVTDDGKTAYAMAVEGNHPETADYLRNKTSTKP